MRMEDTPPPPPPPPHSFISLLSTLLPPPSAHFSSSFSHLFGAPLFSSLPFLPLSPHSLDAFLCSSSIPPSILLSFLSVLFPHSPHPSLSHAPSSYSLSASFPPPLSHSILLYCSCPTPHSPSLPPSLSAVL